MAAQYNIVSKKNKKKSQKNVHAQSHHRLPTAKSLNPKRASQPQTNNTQTIVTSNAVHTSPALPPLKPLTKRGMNKSDRSQSFNTEDEAFSLNAFKASKKRRKSASNKKQKKELKSKLERQNYKITEQQYTIDNLRKELRKYTKVDTEHIMNSDKHYQRTIKHKEKEISNLRRRLKLAINDYEKVYGYYKKQLDLFRKNQQKWLSEQRSNHKDVTKYVFADDIRRLKPRKKGVRIYFGDGEDVIFDNIEVLRDKDYNDDNQYRNLISKVKAQKISKAEAESARAEEKDIYEELDEDDMIILCLNELNARIRDFKHRKEGDAYAGIITERYKKLPIYHIDGDYMRQLKANNNTWLKLFKKEAHKEMNGYRNTPHRRRGMSRLGAFFAAQKEMQNGKQPAICVQNNVILNNINSHGKEKGVKYSQHLQNKISVAVNGDIKMDSESKNAENDENLEGLTQVSVLNGWFTAQIEMNEMNKQPSVCIKNEIKLNKIQNKPKVQNRKMRARNIQKRLDESIQSLRYESKDDGYGHSTNIEMDRGDSSEEDETGANIYNIPKSEQRITGFSDIMNGWFSSQIEIGQSKQPTICVQNNVILNNIESTQDMIEYKDNNNGKSKRKKKRKILNAKALQKKLNETTSNGLSQNALDLSDDESDGIFESAEIDEKSNGKMHANMWYYKNEERTDFIKSVAVTDEDKCKLLLQIGAYLNRLLPTSIDYDSVKQYMPIFTNISDIIAACFDGVLLSVLINFIDDNLIDLRALHLPTNKYPISKEEICENMRVVKLCISSLDLHEFPDFEIGFEGNNSEELAWFNPATHLDILLLIVMHQFMGFLNQKINVFKFPELFRLCQTKIDKQCAQKCAAKEWLHKWIVFVANPNNLHSYHSPVMSGNISWESIKVLPSQSQSQSQSRNESKSESKYVWDIERDYSTDILNVIHPKLGILHMSDVADTIVLMKDIHTNKNHLLQLIYLSDLFVRFDHKIPKLSTMEQQNLYNYLRKLPSSDTSLIAWINAFKIVDSDGNYDYIDNLGEDVSNGLLFLSILDAIKPGSVDWKHSGIRREVRHKFDKINNCNILIELLKKERTFKDIFHLVGIGGNNIVDGHSKYIRSLLLQMQRYHSTKLMAQILFKKRSVTDDELLLWMNHRLSIYKKMVNAMSKMHHNDSSMYNLGSNSVKMKGTVHISAFDDRQAMHDCLNFCNIVSSINPQWINYQCIFSENECQSNQNKKLQNAKYLITVMRRLGCENIFISPKELIGCEHRAILTVSMSIMTIAARYHEYDQLALFARSLAQIKAKMSKK